MQLQHRLSRGAGAHGPCPGLQNGNLRRVVKTSVSRGGFSQQLRTMIGLAAEAVQCKERSEVQLQQTAAVVHPFRVATFNVLVSVQRAWGPAAGSRLCAELACEVVCGLELSALQAAIHAASQLLLRCMLAVAV